MEPMIDTVPTSTERAILWPYVIVRHQTSRLVLLCVSSESGGRVVLPVSSSEEAARSFLLLGALGEGWCVRWCSTGEMISLLLGPYANVERVLLNPLTEPLTAEDVPANSVYREGFIASLIGSRSVG